MLHWQRDGSMEQIAGGEYYLHWEQGLCFRKNEACIQGKVYPLSFQYCPLYLLFTFQLRLNNVVYAAKTFYNTTSNNPNNQPGSNITVGKIENKKHMKDELVRQHLAQISLSKFQAQAASRNVSIYGDVWFLTMTDLDIGFWYFPTDIKIAQAFILMVATPGELYEHCWLVDPYLKTVEERKFSGTQQAGSGKDLAGRTCDALAHFSLFDSNSTFVLVDIQGENWFESVF